MTRERKALAAAVISAATVGLLGALQSVIWNGADAPLATRALAGLLEPGLLQEPASSDLELPTESYFANGRLLLWVYGLLIYAVAALRRHPGSRRAANASICLLVLAALADFGAYWISESQGPLLRRVAFWYTEVPALVTLTLFWTLLGARRLRQDDPMKWLTACLPVSLGATAALGYLPHGLLLGIALTLLPVLEGIDLADRLPASRSTSRFAKVATGLAIALLAIGSALLYRPVLRAGPDIREEGITIVEGLEGARLHVFNTGFNRMSWWLVGRERPWRPVPAFVIEHPRAGLLVFDTGLSDAVAELGEAGMHFPDRLVIESTSSADMLLPSQMRAAGLDPEAVTYVVVSHLHGDHVGQLAAFPNARILGGVESRRPLSEQVGAGEASERVEEIDFANGVPFGPFDDTVDLLGDQTVILLRGGGHAREDLMLLLALEQGPLLLAGDAAVHLDWLESNDVQRIPVDPDRAAEVRNRIRAFRAQAPNGSIAYGHDLREIDCTRSDVECHGVEYYYPEDSPREPAVNERRPIKDAPRA